MSASRGVSDMTDKLPTKTRRTVLSTLGSIAVLTGIGAAGEEEPDTYCPRDRWGNEIECADSADKTETEKQPPQKSEPRTDEAVLETLACGEWPDYRDKKGFPVEGKLEVCNCSPCTRRVIINVTDEIIVDGEEYGDSASIYVRSDEQRTVYFTGSLTRLNIEDGDLNVAISQRSLHESDASQCVRPCERC